MDNTYQFETITKEMSDLYSQKNEKYGNAFEEELDEDGLIVTKIRLNEKMKRLKQLIKSDFNDSDESIQDTLIDIANYCVMTLMWLRK